MCKGTIGLILIMMVYVTVPPGMRDNKAMAQKLSAEEVQRLREQTPAYQGMRLLRGTFG
jgi:hypothetical protein